MEELIVNGVDLSEFVGIPYAVSRHSGSVPVDEFLKNPRMGSNCQLLVLGVLKKAGFHIGKIKIDESNRLGSKELWLDTFFTRGVSLEECKPFSLVFFWPPGSAHDDFKKLHVGVSVCRVDECGEYSVLHNPRGGPSVVWSISTFIRYGYFVHGIKRPRIRVIG